MNWVFLDISHWDYDVTTPLARPLGGSQSALCYLALALARRGHCVTTITGIQQSREVSGVRCLPYNDLHTDIFTAPQTIVVVLNGPAEFVRQVRSTLPTRQPVILWTQHSYDQPAMVALRDLQTVALWDRIVCISDWQRATYEKEFGIPTAKIEVLRNAISPVFENMFSSAAQLAEAKAKELRLVYTSTPFRGLDVLLACFPGVHRQHPTCRLDVFSSMQVYFQSSGDDPYQALYKHCLATPGVVYRGSVSQIELAKELAGATLLAYPNTFAETGCIAAMEALAAGLVVVTSDLGALPETCGNWARLVPPVASGRTMEQFAIDYAWNVHHALTELQSDRPRWIQRCFEQSQAINATCTWEQRAAQWEQAATGWLQYQ